MQVLVLGAGVTGLCAAYRLARDGHAVTVVERNPEAAREASFANGGQLSYSYVAPLASPDVPAKLPGWLLRADAPIRFQLRADAGQWLWGLRFLAACRAGCGAATTARLLRLAGHSRTLMAEAAAREGLRFDHRLSGKLVLYSDPAALAGAKRQMELQRALGSRQEALDPDACLALEPSLRSLRPRLAGGVHTPSEEAGDCRQFCLGLADVLAERYGVSFAWGTPVRGLLVMGGRLRGAVTPAGVMEADAAVLAAGANARHLLRGLGAGLPLYPIKGYSLSLPIADDGAAPRISVTDADRKVVYARLGNVLRVAGLAELAGYDRAINPARLALLVRQAREAFPHAADWERLGPWCGLRPATPSGAPILGAVPGCPNLLLSVGQGALGFTLAMGSAGVVADIVAGRPPGVALDGFLPSDHGVRSIRRA